MLRLVARLLNMGQFVVPAAEEEEEEQCVFAKQFGAWAQKICQEASREPTHVSINQAYLLVFKKYMEWREVAPKNHRNRMGERGHRCIWHVLEMAYLHLKQLELSLSPPLLFLPPAVLPSPLPPPPLLPDIFLLEPK